MSAPSRTLLLWCLLRLVIRAGHSFATDSNGQQQDNGCASDSNVVDELLRTHRKNRLPHGGRVDVSTELWVQEISKINELRSEFELDVYMTEAWSDPSLAFDHLNPCKTNLSLDGGTLLRRLWNPSCCFVNSKSASVHRSPFTNIFLMIYSNGTVWVNYRIKLTGPCEKDLKTFPIDQHRCFLTYESFMYNSDEVRLKWINGNPITLLKEIRLPDYKLISYSALHVQRDYPPGRWHELIATFTFQRQYGFYILQAYVPAYLVVLISWISFFLDVDMIQPRTMLGVHSLLALTFQRAAKRVPLRNGYLSVVNYFTDAQLRLQTLTPSFEGNPNARKSRGAHLGRVTTKDNEALQMNLTTL